MWVVDDEPTIGALTQAFDALPAIYIADGHHRSAAASRVAQARGGSTGSHGYFLSVIFPHHQMTILDYNRVVRDLNGRSAEQLLAALARALRGGGVGSAGAPGCVGRVRHVPRRPLVPADARSEARAAERSDRPPADHAAYRATCSSRCSASPISAPTSASISSAAAAAWTGWSAGLVRRDGGGLRALPDADDRPDGGRRRRR